MRHLGSSIATRLFTVFRLPSQSDIRSWGVSFTRATEKSKKDFAVGERNAGRPDTSSGYRQLSQGKKVNAKLSWLKSPVAGTLVLVVSSVVHGQVTNLGPPGIQWTFFPSFSDGGRASGDRRVNYCPAEQQDPIRTSALANPCIQIGGPVRDSLGLDLEGTDVSTLDHFTAYSNASGRAFLRVRDQSPARYRHSSCRARNRC